MALVLVLSGAVGSGKSTVAEAVLSTFDAQRVSTRQMIIGRKHVASERTALQVAGDELDQETDFGWVAEDVAKVALGGPPIIIVDAVRRSEQIDRLRDRFGGELRHVHVVASEAELVRRHQVRLHDVTEPLSYDDVRRSVTEQGVHRLAEQADVLIDVTRLDKHSIVASVFAGTEYRQVGSRDRLVDVLIGGQFGSEGKGNICSLIATEYQVLVRVGGPNAGHIVYDPFFKFAQLPSGTLHNPDARLVIGPATTLSLEVLRSELQRLQDDHGMEVTSERLSIDPQAIIIEPSDIEWESEKLEVIGSTKQGVGAATARKILGRGKDGSFGAKVRLARDVEELAPLIRHTFVELEKAFAAGERVLLEGTQGTDISLHHGMWPHVTSRDTTAAGCLADAGIAPHRVREVIMVTRSYPIRVGGDSGYMGVEISPEDLARRSGLPLEQIKRTETGTISGKPRRIAEFDLGQVRRAAELNGATCIALTFADYLGSENQDAAAFEALSAKAQGRVRQIEDATGVRVGLISVGPGRSNVIDRRIG
jgi:adenylosuccinate synthase